MEVHLRNYRHIREINVIYQLKKKIINIWYIRKFYIKDTFENAIIMRFITGLKNLSKKKLLLTIVMVFIILWFLFILWLVGILSNQFMLFIVYFLGFFAAFSFTLFIFSIFIPIDKIGITLIVIIAILTIPIVYLFSRIIGLFYTFCFFANFVLVAFFAFKFSIDTSIAIDDYLYKKKSSRIITRSLEFIVFIFISVWIGLRIIRFFRNHSNPHVQSVANVFIILYWIDLILLAFVLIRLIFTKKLAAYISFFTLLTIICMLFFIFSLFADILFINTFGYIILSFFIDLFLFIYIIGSIFGRVEYLQEKIKILRADTIGLFVILMKIIVQIVKISQDLGLIPLYDIVTSLLGQIRIILFFFVIFTLLIGLYKIFIHKEGKNS